MSDATARRRAWMLVAGLVSMCAAQTTGWPQAGRSEEQPALVAAPESQTPRPWTLEQCIAAAFRSNPTVCISTEGIVSAEAAVRQARSGYYPTAELTADATLGNPRTSDSGTTVSGNSAGADLAIDWTLFETGRSESVGESRSELTVARLAHVITLRDLARDVAVDYYAVLAARELVQVAEDGLQAAKEHLQAVEARIRHGTTAEVDRFAADSDVAQADLDLIDARTGVLLAVARLRNLIGLDHTVAFDVAPAGAEPEVPAPPLSEAVAQALLRRPEIAEAEASRRAREYAAERADKARGPSLSLSTSLGYGLSTGNSTGGTVRLSGGLSWPLFSRALAASEDSARSALRRAQASQRSQALGVGLEVEEALIEVERTAQQIQTGEKAVAAAEARLRAARGRYANEVGILLDLTDARADLTSAQASLVSVRFDHQVALVALRHAMGNLPIPSPTETENGGDGRG